MAFDGDVLAVGSYHGFNLHKLDKDGTPKLISSIVCPGGQGDVSIVGDLLLMSVEQTRGRIDCGLEGVGQDVSQERFRGLRIFDISNLKNPNRLGPHRPVAAHIPTRSSRAPSRTASSSSITRALLPFATKRS